MGMERFIKRQDEDLRKRGHAHLIRLLDRDPLWRLTLYSTNRMRYPKPYPDPGFKFKFLEIEPIDYSDFEELKAVDSGSYEECLKEKSQNQQHDPQSNNWLMSAIRSLLRKLRER